MKYRNIITGNILNTENKDAIALMEKSAIYEPVKAQPSKDSGSKTK